jgi:hypothetical protein
MNIIEFKVGDVITRNAPCTYGHNGMKDGSYTGDKIVFLGVDTESKLIFLLPDGDKEPDELSYARERWDEGWCFYPLSLLEKAKEFIKNL